MDVQAIEEDFSLQKRTSSTLKHEISYFFFYFCGYWALLDPNSDSGSGYGSIDLIESGSNQDPDSKHWFV